eukprot:Opistho-2@86394
MSVPKFRKDHSVWINIAEAKNLDSSIAEDALNTYVCVKINKREKDRTKTVKKNRTPLWNDDFYFNLNDEFKDLALVVWNEKKQSDQPLGIVAIPREFLASDQKQHEEWFTIEPAKDEGKVSGQIQLELVYTRGEKSDQLDVKVLQGSDLVSCDANGLSDPYVCVHLLPDDNLSTSRKTKVKKETLTPAFNEDFSFTIPKDANGNPKYTALHVSVWDWDRFSQDDFMGQVIVLINDIINKSEAMVTKDVNWHVLTPRTIIDPLEPSLVSSKPHDLHTHTYYSPAWCQMCGALLKGVIRQGMQCKQCGFNCHEKCEHLAPKNCRGDHLKRYKKAGGEIGTSKLSKCQLYILDTQGELLARLALDPQGPQKGGRPHNFEVKHFKTGSNCAQCFGSVWMVEGAHCRNCGLNVHEECKKKMPQLCGLVGQLRIKYKYTEEPILPLQVYEPFMSLIFGEELYLINLLQDSTAQKEDVGRALVRVYEAKGECPAFLRSMSAMEITATNEANTIFRGNSLVTKAFDAYLKLHGMGYLHSVLKPVLAAIMADAASCEVDGTRLDKAGDLDKNWKTLKSHVTATCDAIFKSINNCPAIFRQQFAHIRELVLTQFPQDPVIKYTAVSGFIFLRFFCPAILGPQLFDMAEEIPDPKTARALTLIAKTLQNLANLVEFGQKEPYMARMNEVIVSRMSQMRAFLDTVSTSTETPAVVTPQIDLELETARLYRFFLQSREKMQSIHTAAGMTEPPAGSDPRVGRATSWDANSRDTSDPAKAARLRRSQHFQKFLLAIGSIEQEHDAVIMQTSERKQSMVPSTSTNSLSSPKPHTKLSRKIVSAQEVEECTATLLRVATQTLGDAQDSIGDQEGLLNATRPLVIVSHQLIALGDHAAKTLAAELDPERSAVIVSAVNQLNSRLASFVAQAKAVVSVRGQNRAQMDKLVDTVKALGLAASGVMGAVTN